MSSVEIFLDAISNYLFGLERSEALKKKICVHCKKEVKIFKDNMDRIRYEISALCVECWNLDTKLKEISI